MKNEILDTPFHHSFSDFLKQGETIIWEGQPMLDASPDKDVNKKTVFWVFLSATVLFFFVFEKISFSTFIFFIIALSYVIVSELWKRQQKLNIKYALTQKQILFELREKWYKSKTFYAIPFSEIRDVVVVLKYDVEQIAADAKTNSQGRVILPEPYLKKGIEKLGTIFLATHHPQLISFETLDLSNNGKRHQPTLELLEDAEAVAEMIRTGIKNANL